jgi:tryptophan synthase beta chain
LISFGVRTADMNAGKETKARATFLGVDEIPTEWYNIKADLPETLPPPLDPETLKPISSAEPMMRILAKELVLQNISTEKWIQIPEEVLEAFRWILRPTPLMRAYKLEEYLNTPAKIFYKWEGMNPAGSYKANTALAQAHYSKKQGIQRLVSGTAAGQWGSALSMACAHFGLKATVFMDKLSYGQKPGRKTMMQAWGAECIPSPSNRTRLGRSFLSMNPDERGSGETSIGEAMEEVMTDENSRFAMPSAFDCVAIHQSIIGLEAKKQLEKLDLEPDVLAACIGGGSNFSGICFPFLGDKLKRNTKTEFVACESKAIPRATRGKYAYDSFGKSPLTKAYTLGKNFREPATHTAGLRARSMSPMVSHLLAKGYVRAVSFGETEVFEAASIFAKTEGIIAAPESAHVIRFAIDEARRCKQTGESKVIVFNCSGHGLLDLSAYEAYQSGQMEDWEPSEMEIPTLVPE